MESHSPPPLSAAVQAAVEQEARFKNLEAGVDECRIQQTHTVQLFDLRLQDLTATLTRDKAELDRRHDELLDIAKQALEASQRTNGSVAETIAKMGQLSSKVADQRLDIEELSGGLQAVREAQRLRDGRDGTAAAKRDGYWAALGWQWKILLGLAAGSGALIALAANIATILHLAK